MSASPSRPRVVDAAFWVWVLAAVALVLAGLLLALARADVPIAYRGFGAVFAAAGLGLAYLARQTRSGDARFRRAAVTLSFTLAVLLVLFTLMLGQAGLVWLLAIALLVTAAVLVTRPSAQSWFDVGEPR